MIKVKFEPRQLKNLQTTMKRIEQKGKLIGNDLVKQVALNFLESVVIETPPGRSSKIGGKKKEKLRPNSARYRKKVSISQKVQAKMGRFYYLSLKDNKIISRKEKIKPREQRGGYLIPITRFFEARNRKNSKKYYIPINPTDKGEESKSKMIPKAGSSKAGWLGAISKILKSFTGDTKGISKRVNTTNIKKGWNPFIYIKNNVRYSKKIAPNSVNKSLAKTTRKLENKFLPKADREFTEMFRAKRASYASKYGVKL